MQLRSLPSRRITNRVLARIKLRSMEMCRLFSLINLKLGYGLAISYTWMTPSIIVSTSADFLGLCYMTA